MACWPGAHSRKSRQSRAQCRSFLPLLLLLSAVFLCACPPPVVRVPVSSENVVKANQCAAEADLAFAHKDYYAALIKYLEAGRLNPNSEYIQNKIGIAYSQLKYYPEALAAFQRAIGLNSKYAYPYNNLGTVYFATFDKKGAERSFKKALSLNPNVASFHVNLGTLYFENKKFDKGLAEWRKGLAIDPNALSKSEGISLSAGTGKSSSSEKNYFLARLYASMGDVIHALESLRLALNAGFTDIAAINSEKDFDPIRNDERFLQFMKTTELLNRP